MNHLPPAYLRTLPDKNQTLLLKACLTEDAGQALHYWNTWINQNHYDKPTFKKNEHLLPQVFDHLDFGSQRLLSLLYKKMSIARVDDPFIAELKGYYRYVWVRNQVFRNQLEEIVKLLAAGEVTYVIIKGIPTIEFFYKDWGLRSVMDIDLAIHPQHWMKAITILKKNGWENKYANKNPEWIIVGLTHAHTLTKGGFELDLHIGFLHRPLNEITKLNFWSGVQHYKAFHTMLKPEHQLLCSFVHGMEGKDEATRTVADTTYMLRTQSMDWEEVITTAGNGNLLIPLITFTNYLVQERFVTISDEILNRINSQTVTPFEFDFFKLVTKPTAPNGLNQLKIKFMGTSVLASSISERIKILLTNYKFEWGVRSVPEFIFAFAWVGFNKLFYRKQKIHNRKIPFLSRHSS